MSPATITATMTNDTPDQQVFFATDDDAPASADRRRGLPGWLGGSSGDTVHVTLVVDADGYGEATGGYAGNVLQQTRLSDNDSIYPGH